MGIVTFRNGSDWSSGISHDGFVVAASRLPSLARRGDLSTKGLLALGGDALRTAMGEGQALIAASGEGVLELDSVQLGPPVLDPDKILCIGLNYRDHVTEVAFEVPAAPAIFPKFRNSLIGAEAPIVLPAVTREVDYEGELAVVIGERCRDADESRALEYVVGYTVFNDVSARDIQFRTTQWTAGKALDGFAPVGPEIVPAADIPDPQSLTLTTRLNGEVMQHEATGMMIFSVAQIVAYISSVMTLEPGDIIATGTPAGVGFKREPPVYLEDGDVVEVEIERVGLLRNPVVRPADA
jgi:acylpyruvate hydrolase